MLGHRPGARGERHADDGRQQLRRQTDRERDRKEQRLDHWPAKKLVHRQHEQNDDDHHADQEVAELPYAAPELRLGRARLEPRDDRAEGGSASGLDRKNLRRAALHRSAEVDRVGASGDGRLRRNGPGLLLDGEGFPGQAGLVDQKVLGLDHEPVGGNEIAGREHDDVAGHDGARRDGLFKAVAEHTACQCQAALELLDRGRRPVLLIEAKQRTAEHDRQNDACIDPLPQRQRNHGARR